MTRYRTLLLDQTAWDLVIDSAGNIAAADPPYSLAQDVASAIKLFLGELWFDSTKGIPYFQQILSYKPPASLITGFLEKAALTVPGVVSVRVVLNSLTNREVRGQVLFTDEQGFQNGINF
jgi:hypothetical protein